MDSETFALRTKIRISFIKGVMDINGKIAEKIPSKFVKLKADTNGLGSSINLESGFTMEDGDNSFTQTKTFLELRASILLIIDIFSHFYPEAVQMSILREQVIWMSSTKRESFLGQSEKYAT